MMLEHSLSTPAVLNLIGDRLRQQRIGQSLSQADLAERSGVSLRTIERLEAGEGAGLDKFIQVLRSLNLVASLDLLLPEIGLRPIEEIDRGPSSHRRRRVSTARRAAPQPAGWTWGDRK